MHIIYTPRHQFFGILCMVPPPPPNVAEAWTRPERAARPACQAGSPQVGSVFASSETPNSREERPHTEATEATERSRKPWRNHRQRSSGKLFCCQSF